MSASPLRADMLSMGTDVRFVPIADLASSMFEGKSFILARSAATRPRGAFFRASFAAAHRCHNFLEKWLTVHSSFDPWHQIRDCVGNDPDRFRSRSPEVYSHPP